MSEQNHQIYEFGPFHLDASRRLLLRDGAPVKLFPKEFETLLALVERSGQELDKDELMKRVWGETIVEESNLAKNISHLRKVLGETPNQHEYIVTLPGQGYRFVAGVRTGTFDELVVHERTRAAVTIEERSDPPVSATTTSSRPNILTLASFRSVGVAAGALLFLVLLGAAWFLRQGESRPGMAATTRFPFQQIAMKRLPVSGDPRGGAVLSPDGKLFAYVVMDNEGHQSLWLGHVNGGEAVQLRKPAEFLYFGLGFAPDGENLYFSQSRAYSSESDLYRMPVFGGVAERIKENVRGHITFSPDAKQFAFIRSNTGADKSSVIIADVDGGAEREIASRPLKLAFSRDTISWSRDGKFIAVSAINNEVGSDNQIFIVSVPDGSNRPLTGRGWNEVRMTEWLNDSSGLLVVAIDRESSWGAQLWHLSYPSGEVRRLVNDLHTYSHTSNLSADNRSLLTLRGQFQSNIWIAPATEPGQATQITHDALGVGNGWNGMEWTTENRIVFTVNLDHKPTIWISKSDGNEKKQLSPSGSLGFHPTVSADGRYVVFESDRSGTVDIWRVNTDGSDLKQLSSGGNNTQPHVSPDGNSIFYRSIKGSKVELWRMNIHGDDKKRLTELPASWPRVSPDGKLIACVYDRKLAILPASGGEPNKTFDVARLANFNNGLRWTPDGKAITYRDGANGVWMQSVGGGEPRRIEGLPAEKLYSYAWSPDGKYLAFTRGSELRDIVLIQDLK